MPSPNSSTQQCVQNAPHPRPPSSQTRNLPNSAIPASASIPAKHVPTNPNPPRISPSSRGPPVPPDCTCTCTCSNHNQNPSPLKPEQIPAIYRIYHLYLEPTFSLSGALHLYLFPQKYHAYTPSSVSYIPAAEHTYNQLAACYVLIALFEAFFLRKFVDRKIWDGALTVLFWCDIGHFLADVWEEFPPRGLGWVAMAVTVVGLVVRMCFVNGVGFDDEDEKDKQRGKED